MEGTKIRIEITINDESRGYLDLTSEHTIHEGILPFVVKGMLTKMELTPKSILGVETNEDTGGPFRVGVPTILGG